MADIASIAGQQMVEQGMHQVANPGGGGPVNVEDQLRFEQAMEGSGVEKVPEEAVEQAAQTTAAGQPETMGDTILKGLQDLKVNHDVKMESIQNQLQIAGTEDLSFKDAMRLQMDVMQLTMQEDLATKVADKASQGVQQMFKNQ